MIGPGLLAPAGNVEDELKYLLPYFLDTRSSGRDPARVNVDQIPPALC
jgi:hypothetical protein